jgi:hypothetical protein
VKLKLPARFLYRARRVLGRPGPIRDVSVGKTLIIFNKSDLLQRVGHESLVVCGAAKGRTSVVSYVLRRSGYFIGDRLQEKNHEDLDFVAAIAGENGRSRKICSMRDLGELIAARNASHARWGFKLPGAVAYLSTLEPMLRNPVFMICLRNPVGVFRSLSTYRPDLSGDPNRLILPAFRAIREAEEQLNHVRAPTILADMDAAQADPVAFVTELAAALQLQVDPQVLGAEIGHKGYKRLPGNAANPTPDANTGFTSAGGRGNVTE